MVCTHCRDTDHTVWLLLSFHGCFAECVCQLDSTIIVLDNRDISCDTRRAMSKTTASPLCVVSSLPKRSAVPMMADEADGKRDNFFASSMVVVCCCVASNVVCSPKSNQSKLYVHGAIKRSAQAADTGWSHCPAMVAPQTPQQH